MKPKNYLLSSLLLLLSFAKTYGQCNPAPVLTISGGVCAGTELNAAFNISGTLHWKKGDQITATQTVSLNGSISIVAGGGWPNESIGYPNRFVLDAAGDLYIPDMFDGRVERWTPGAKSGITVAGGNGWGTGALHLDEPTSVALDSRGNLFVCERGNHRVTKWAPGASSGEVVLHNLSTPTGIFIDAQDNLYVSEQRASQVIRLAPGATNPVVVAGGNGFGAAANQLSTPTGIYVDAAGNLFICDTDNNRVQQWAPGASSGKTVAGGNGLGNQLNQLANPLAISGDAAGTLFISDFTNRRIVKWPAGSGAGTLVIDKLNGAAIRPSGIVAGPSGTLYFADVERSVVVRLTPPQNTATFRAQTPGLYTATITNTEGCTATSNEILILPLQQPDIVIATPATTLCPGTASTFTTRVAEVGTHPTYAWRKNGVIVTGSNETLTLTDLANNDVISCVVYASGQCLAAATDTSNAITIALHPVATPLRLGPDRRVCPGTEVTFTIGSATTPIVWQQTVTSNSFTVDAPGTYVATTSDVCGGSFSDTVAVLHFPPPADFLNATAAVCTKGAIELKAATGFKQYRWSNGSNTAETEVRLPGWYHLQITDRNDCSRYDSILVRQIECGERIYFPNSFTPNGDGRNDLLRPTIFSMVRQYRFTVYNRWGNAVFQTTEPGKGWTGMVNGLPQNGVFAWTCTYQFVGEPVQESKGTVVLIR